MTEREEKSKESEVFITNGDTQIKQIGVDDLSRVPLDRGWAWMVLLGGVLAMAIVIGCNRTSGILFVEFQRKFKSSATTTSIITTIQNAVFCISAPIIMTAGMKLVECRFIVLVGSISMCMSFVFSSIATNINIVMASHGILQGFALACMEPTSMSMVTKYFKKRRGLSNSVTSAGMSIGGLIFPPLVTKLFKVYGYKGCLLIIGAINLNTCISAMLFRPLTFYRYHQNNNYVNGKAESKYDKDKKKTISQILYNILKYFDFKLFVNPLFVLFQIGFGFITAAAVLSIVFIPPNAKHIGISDENTALIMSIFSCVDMFCRVLYGVIADTGICRRSTLVAISGVIFGISTICVRYYTTFGLLVMHAVIIGATSGSTKSLYPGIIVDYLSIKKLDSTIGFAMLTLGLSNGTFIFIGGYLKDYTSSFASTFYLIGTITLIGAASMTALPFVQKRRKADPDVICSTLTIHLSQNISEKTIDIVKEK